MYEIPGFGRITGVLRGFTTEPTIFARRADDDDERSSYLSAVAQVAGDRFTIANLPAGTYEVVASSERDSASARVVVSSGMAATLALDAALRAHVSALVTDARSGQAIAGASCLAQSVLNHRGGMTAGPAASDASGAFALDVPPGRMRIVCWARPMPSSPLREVVVDLEAGATASVAVELLVAQHIQEWGRPRVQLEEVGGAPHIVFVPRGDRSSGLRSGDRLLQIDGRPVAGLALTAVELLLGDRPAGSVAKLVVERGGTELTLEVAAGSL